MNAVAERSAALFDSGLYCAESVLQAVVEHEGIDSALVPKMATGFCGGMARNSGPCGVVSGAVMAIGLLHGRSDSQASDEVCYRMVNTFIGKFTEAFGGIGCTELLGCDLARPEEMATAREENRFETICRPLVAKGTELLMEVLHTS